MDLMATGISGLKSATQSINGSASRIATLGTTETGQGPQEPRKPEVDFTAEYLNIQAKGEVYKANLKVIQTAQQVLGTAMDLKA